MAKLPPDSIDHTAGIFQKLHYVWLLSSVIKEREGIPRWPQFWEMLGLRVRRGLGPLVYFEQQLWRRDITAKEKLGCLSKKEYNAVLAEHNPLRYRCIARHKVVETGWLKLFGIPSCDFLGVLHPNDGIDAKGNKLTDLDAMACMLEELSPLALCLKPVSATKGQGVRAVRIEQRDGGCVACHIHDGGSAQTLRSYLEEEIAPAVGDGLILQRYIEQHPQLSAFNASSVNTIRLWVLQCGEEVKVRGAILRMGRAGEIVDNSSAGGVLAPIDLATGRLGKVKTMTVYPELLDEHPDTGARVCGQTLPFWPEILQLAKETVRVMPMLHFSGLDIAVTESGPIIVETNAHPSRVSARNFSGSMQDLLDCSFD